MSRIRGKNTGIELVVRKRLWALGFRGYRTHSPKVLGSPDITFRKKKVTIFLDGDFWHGYNLTRLGKKVPKKYWLPKIRRNMLRDKASARKLRKAGWKVLRFWEHDIKKKPKIILKRIMGLLLRASR